MITHEQIVVAAKQRLRISDTTEYDALLGSWIYDGVRAARWPTTKKISNCTLTISNNVAKLPSNFSKFLALQIDCRSIAYYEEDFFSQCTSSCANRLSDIGQIIGNEIHFGSSITEEEAELAYFSLNTDNDGFMIIHDEDELALVYYLCREFSRMFPERFYNHAHRDFDRDFKAEANNARGIKNLDRVKRDMNKLFVIMNSIVESGGNLGMLRHRYFGTRFV